MAFDAYIHIDNIPGEALDEKHNNWIEILGYDFGISQSTSATASSVGGATSGRTSVTNFTFTKSLDSASCKLLEASCTGQHLKEVKLALCRAGGDKLKYYEIILEEVIIAEYSQGVDTGIPLEVVQLNYGRIKTIYIQQRRVDGSGGGNISGGWDRIGNKKYA
ncbi:type VI secretion system tube protein Hcp [Pseudomonas sp. NC26]|uniref:Type VI secretion system tube protein Hcp n=1 Tax=Pseudomonas putida TaxID=303 RepID=A0A7W2KZG6_PSEPU|nr:MULTISPECIES: type VI secretion system tube protein Hcp [Pseudomonas]MBA6115635.1 type VI secretion system tube protein Hcp [Pseudomonas putida]MCZ9635905.1 type VI secretion system tube protein Hcp [Pseudomonas putida]MEC4878942.1 type VI secretion system tube protein Hcp [Pseudomonas sp. NC26]QNL89866.1 Type VI secretion system tube protein Hcp [Pseudomonas putida]